MHATFDGIDIVNEGVHVFTVPLLVLHSNIHNDFIFFPFKSNHRWIYQVFAFIKELYKFCNPACIMELFFMGSSIAMVRQSDGEAFV